MTKDNRRNIKVDPELFEKMKADKGGHRSWPQYFRDECLSGEVEGEQIRQMVREEIRSQLNDE